MSQRDPVEEELLEECGFWKRFTGVSRRPATRWVTRLYWFCRVFARALALTMVSRTATPARPAPAQPCDILLIYFTRNQSTALAPWMGASPGIQTASCMGNPDWWISWRRCGELTLRFIWPVYRLLRRRPDHAATIPWLEDFVRYQAGLQLASDLYDRARPRVVVISNDHSGECRAFIRVARARGCPVVYTQHASIGRNFPPLDFDLVLLDGAQAYLQYLESGVPRGAIVITGRHRPSAQAPRTAASRRLGLATNFDDSLLEWLPLLRKVGKQVPGAVLRCHPAEPRKRAWRMLCRLCRVGLDTGSLDAFLRETSVLISGVSGIVLDAALHGVPCLMKVPSLRDASDVADYYGYEKFGLCRRLDDLEGLRDLVASSAAEAGGVERAGAYEAGLVQAPDEEKRAALALFVSGLGGDARAALAQRYVRVEHRGVELFLSSEYAGMCARNGWLS